MLCPGSWTAALGTQHHVVQRLRTMMQHGCTSRSENALSECWAENLFGSLAPLVCRFLLSFCSCSRPSRPIQGTTVCKIPGRVGALPMSGPRSWLQTTQTCLFCIRIMHLGATKPLQKLAALGKPAQKKKALSYPDASVFTQTLPLSSCTGLNVACCLSQEAKQPLNT